ncbi:MAG: hypothetical protein JSR18_01980 [Proteobacteria bacterium]|nr:hypothetical protein [Pseudomonadota bacterium]
MGDLRIVRARVLSAALAFLAVGGIARAGEVAPIAPGAYPVGCTDIEQDFSRVGVGETAAYYWEGVPASDGRARSVLDLAVAPASVPHVNVTLPANGELYSDFAGKTLDFPLLVCYPTTTTNGRANYTLPNGAVVPHMQKAGDAPLFNAARAQWPVLLFSHGLEGSPLDPEYVGAMTVLASHGYVVVAPFHMDQRIADLGISDLEDLVNALLQFPDYTAMQAIRPRTLSAALDAILAPPWAGHVDAANVAGFGASLGGESLVLLAGAQLTSSLGLSSQQVIADPRLKAIVGYVPYFGQPILPAFGRDQNGIDAMLPIPMLSISGTADIVAPLEMTYEGMQRMTTTRILVALAGVEHGFDVPSTNDIFTWSLAFLNAQTARDPVALATLQRMTNVAGGGTDSVVIDYVAPYPATGHEVDVIEYYNAGNGHYFMTASPLEIGILDAGTPIAGWVRTGYAFKAYAEGSGMGTPTCRFYGTPGTGPDTHFYTLYDFECAILLKEPLTWTFEGLVFEAGLPVNGTCPANTMVVSRYYNNGQGGVPNHRYTTSPVIGAELLANGWVPEGPAMCTPP